MTITVAVDSQPLRKKFKLPDFNTRFRFVKNIIFITLRAKSRSDGAKSRSYLKESSRQARTINSKQIFPILFITHDDSFLKHHYALVEVIDNLFVVSGKNHCRTQTVDFL